MACPKSAFLILSLSLLSTSLAQQTCSGQPIAAAQAIAPNFPPLTPGVPVDILPGDEDARALFNSIVAAGGAAVNIPPTQLNQGVVVPGTYNAGADPNCWWTASNCKIPKHEGLVADLDHCATASTWALSVDDGPSCQHGMLYDAFAQANQRASLYYIGLNVLQYPEAAQNGYNAGHEICAHTWSHSYMTTLTNSQVFAELYYSKKAIKDIIGVSTRCWRPPYGDIDDRVRTFAQGLDMASHLWTRDSDDWRAASEANGVAIVTGNYQNIINQEADSNTGIVVLQHETAVEYMQAFLNAWPQIQQRFAHTMPVSTCNNETRLFAEDETPDYPTFSQYASGTRAQPWDATPYSAQDLVFDGNSTLATSIASSAVSSSSALSSSAATSVVSSNSGRPSRSASLTASRSAANNAVNTSTSSAELQSSISAILLLASMASFCML